MMIRSRILCLRAILSKSTVLYSTAITPSKNTKYSLIQRLLDEFTEAKPVILKLKKYEQVNIQFKEWKNRIDLMKKYGFSELECFKMISDYPSMLEIPLPKFEGSIQQWHLAIRETEQFRTILLNQPVLLEVDEAVIVGRVSNLRPYFGSSNLLVYLLKNSPNVMHDNWEGVLTKINYLLKERRFNAGEVAQCSALSASLDFIKFRFDLLEKCGVYKQSRVPVHKVNKYDRSGHVNPSLKSMLVTSPEKFARIAKISTEEYEVFRDLFMADEGDETDSDTDE